MNLIIAPKFYSQAPSYGSFSTASVKERVVSLAYTAPLAGVYQIRPANLCGKQDKTTLDLLVPECAPTPKLYVMYYYVIIAHVVL